MPVLTTSQLTFCDLKDSYSVHVDTDCIGVVCDNSGVALEDQSVTISYRVFAGSSLVAASCEVSELPSGVTLVSNVASSSAKDGVITIKIHAGATLNNNITESMKLTFATLDSERFSFEKYITFVKSIAGFDGSDAVNFQIYSVDGFEFGGSLTSITLKTVAIRSGILITSGAKYTWFWWNKGSTLSDKYEIISGETSSTLTVNDTDPYALTGLKCVMEYDGLTYEDHISLTKRTDIYTATAKFFNGNNIITSDNDYIIIYVELYKNNTPSEQIRTDKVYISDQNMVENGIITTDIAGEYADGDMVYFVYKSTYNEMTEYNVVLGQYTSGTWNVIENSYVYINDLFPHSTSNVVFVPKEKISRSLSVNFEVCDENNIVARTSAIVFDLNDPMVSDTAPTSPKEGQLWLDMSVSPSVLKMWDGTQWVKSGYQDGNIVYTQQPDNYTKGDLWILSEDDEDIFGELCAGTMLKAITTSSVFDRSHWVDVDKEATEQKKNIKQYFLFNTTTGLRIGQSDDKFYVNISSTRMSFCENPLVQSSTTNEVIDPNEVVSISNQAAKIKNLTVEDGATFNCEIKFWNFILTQESNGSLSLSVQ